MSELFEHLPVLNARKISRKYLYIFFTLSPSTIGICSIDWFTGSVSHSMCWYRITHQNELGPVVALYTSSWESGRMTTRRNGTDICVIEMDIYYRFQLDKSCPFSKPYFCLGLILAENWWLITVSELWFTVTTQFPEISMKI